MTAAAPAPQVATMATLSATDRRLARAALAGLGVRHLLLPVGIEPLSVRLSAGRVTPLTLAWVGLQGAQREARLPQLDGMPARRVLRAAAAGYLQALAAELLAGGGDRDPLVTWSVRCAPWTTRQVIGLVLRLVEVTCAPQLVAIGQKREEGKRLAKQVSARMAGALEHSQAAAELLRDSGRPEAERSWAARRRWQQAEQCRKQGRLSAQGAAGGAGGAVPARPTEALAERRLRPPPGSNGGVVGGGGDGVAGSGGGPAPGAPPGRAARRGVQPRAGGAVGADPAAAVGLMPGERWPPPEGEQKKVTRRHFVTTRALAFSPPVPKGTPLVELLEEELGGEEYAALKGSRASAKNRHTRAVELWREAVYAHVCRDASLHQEHTERWLLVWKDNGEAGRDARKAWLDEKGAELVEAGELPARPVADPPLIAFRWPDEGPMRYADRRALRLVREEVVREAQAGDQRRLTAADLLGPDFPRVDLHLPPLDLSWAPVARAPKTPPQRKKTPRRRGRATNRSRELFTPAPVPDPTPAPSAPPPPPPPPPTAPPPAPPQPEPTPRPEPTPESGPLAAGQLFATRLVVLDTEGTGFSREAEVHEIGAVLLDVTGTELDTYEGMGKPRNLYLKGIRRALARSNLTLADLRRRTRPIAEVLAEFAAWWRGHGCPPCCAYNHSYDPRVLRQTGLDGLLWAEDILRIAKRASGEKRFSLDVAGPYYGVMTGEQTHRALDDARLAARVLCAATRQLKAKESAS